MLNPTPLLLTGHLKLILETEKDITFVRLPHKLTSVIQQDKLTNHPRSEWTEFTITRQACLHNCKATAKRQKAKGNNITCVRRELHSISFACILLLQWGKTQVHTVNIITIVETGQYIFILTTRHSNSGKKENRTKYFWRNRKDSCKSGIKYYCSDSAHQEIMKFYKSGVHISIHLQNHTPWKASHEKH